MGKNVVVPRLDIVDGIPYILYGRRCHKEYCDDGFILLDFGDTCMGTALLNAKKTFRGKPVRRNALRDTEQVFVMEYLANGLNPTEAMMATFPDSCRKTAPQRARTMLRKPRVNAYLRKVLDSRLDALGLSAELVWNKVLTVITLDPIDFFEDGDIDGVYRIKSLDEIPPHVRQCMQGIECKTRENEFGVEVDTKIKWMDKDHALDLATKLLGLIRDTNVNVNVASPTIDFDKLCCPVTDADVIEGRIEGRVEILTGDGNGDGR